MISRKHFPSLQSSFTRLAATKTAGIEKRAARREMLASPADIETVHAD